MMNKINNLDNSIANDTFTNNHLNEKFSLSERKSSDDARVDKLMTTSESVPLTSMYA